MDFEAAVHAIAALAGERVEAEIWGLEDGSAPVAFLSGVLRAYLVRQGPAFGSRSPTSLLKSTREASMGSQPAPGRQFLGE